MNRLENFEICNTLIVLFAFISARGVNVSTQGNTYA